MVAKIIALALTYAETLERYQTEAQIDASGQMIVGTGMKLSEDHENLIEAIKEHNAEILGTRPISGLHRMGTEHIIQLIKNNFNLAADANNNRLLSDALGMVAFCDFPQTDKIITCPLRVETLHKDPIKNLTLAGTYIAREIDRRQLGK